MDDVEIYNRLTSIFMDILDNDDIVLTPDTTAADIDEWDSLSHILLVVSTESVFSIKFNVGEIEALENVGQFADLIMEKRGG